MTFTVASMFSGAGGMDLGFRGGFEFLGTYYNKNPFEIVWAVDNDKAACATYSRNLGEIHHADAAGVIDTIPDNTDVIIGGFPCQDVSQMGFSSRSQSGEAGNRTSLYRLMVDAVERVRPAAFVAENVKGLLSERHRHFYSRIINDFSALGYHMSARLYCAAGYGVPQIRERVIIVGMVADTYAHPLPRGRHISIKEAISDLEDMPENPVFSHNFTRSMGGWRDGNLKLNPRRPAFTITTNTSSLRWHYSLPRRMTPREAARAQSFPDWFLFPSKASPAMRVIGNAVPPLLAWHVAAKLGNYMEAS